MKSARTVQREIWPCKDGFVSFALRGGPARIPGLIAMTAYMDEHGMASAKLKAIDWKRYNHNLLTQDEVDELTREFGAFFMTKTMTELYRVACDRGLMLAPINSAREIAASEQLAARSFFVDVAGLRYPGAFAITSAGRDAVSIRRPAPRLGEHTGEVLGEIGLAPADVARLREEGVV
jgi:crotonobetainyl-CoA:carnitine CoA-transferase CaiB-like acyl-CoA transferase